MITDEDLLRELENIIKQIPKGKVSTFYDVALALGDRYALKYIVINYKKVNGPWWRVVNKNGEIKDKKQEELLRLEGIQIKNKRIVDLDKYIFRDFKSNRPLQELRKIQMELSKKIVIKDEFDKIEYIGGVDLGYKENEAIVSYVILEYPSLQLIDSKIFRVKVNFPYIPTFLAFREGEPIIKTFPKLSIKPDVLFVNGQGIAHPFSLGLASYVGVILDIPTVGITKKHLFGKIIEDKILINNKIVGYVLKKNNNKIYVSPGHKVSVNTAKELANKAWIKGKYPEPIRLADYFSKMHNNEKRITDYL